MTFQQIQTFQAQAYATLMKDLNLTNEELIQYMQINLIKDYPNGDMVIAINDNDSTQSSPTTQ